MDAGLFARNSPGELSLSPAHAIVADRPQQSFWLDQAVNGLRRARPEFSAASPLVPWQRRVLIGLSLVVPLAAWLAPQAMLGVALYALALPVFCAALVKIYALWAILAGPTGVPPELPLATIAEEGLPSYSLLVALYREAEVAPALVAAMAALRYPAAKVEILFLVEAGDMPTRAALERSGPSPNMSIITVPAGLPRTKPRALNYGLTFASGERIAVYDAEDIPEPDQLLRAVQAFAASPVPLACVQARLNVYNSDAGPVARQFTLEYCALFDAILPALAKLGWPVPLGGTSNHFCRAALDAAGGWDPFNVTEDADLGFRLARLGQKIGIIPSTTWEEAPVTFAAWFGQRTRWLKGWMQTYLVHTRDPLQLWRELGPWGFIGFQILMAGMIASALVHPLFFAVLSVKCWSGSCLGLAAGGAATPVWQAGLLGLSASYTAAIALAMIMGRRRGFGTLTGSALCIPFYWLAISAAAYSALIELCRFPYHWQKTAHTARPVTISTPAA